MSSNSPLKRQKTDKSSGPDESESIPDLLVSLCRDFFKLGWCSGTGGGIAIRSNDRKTVFIAPSGVQKERIAAKDLFVMDNEGITLVSPANDALRPSACTPLFFKAFNIRNAGACIHSHGMECMLVTRICTGNEFKITHQEMIKGIRGHGYHDTLVVPIIENTAHEAELADSLEEAIRAYPKTYAVLVRNHGVYIWGDSWEMAKTQAEVYHYLFDAFVKLHQLGIDASQPPKSLSK